MIICCWLWDFNYQNHSFFLYYFFIYIYYHNTIFCLCSGIEIAGCGGVQIEQEHNFWIGINGEKRGFVGCENISRARKKYFFACAITRNVFYCFLILLSTNKSATTFLYTLSDCNDHGNCTIYPAQI